jgi:excisionase family DNA binding protein
MVIYDIRYFAQHDVISSSIHTIRLGCILPEQDRTRSELMKLQDYLRVKEAAKLLGVAPNTLRNWERSGKIVTHRHPVNGYRLYKKSDLEAILVATERSASRGSERIEHSTTAA